MQESANHMLLWWMLRVSSILEETVVMETVYPVCGCYLVAQMSRRDCHATDVG